MLVSITVGSWGASISGLTAVRGCMGGGRLAASRSQLQDLRPVIEKIISKGENYSEPCIEEDASFLGTSLLPCLRLPWAPLSPPVSLITHEPLASLCKVTLGLWSHPGNPISLSQSPGGFQPIPQTAVLANFSLSPAAKVSLDKIRFKIHMVSSVFLISTVFIFCFIFCLSKQSCLPEGLYLLVT